MRALERHDHLTRAQLYEVITTSGILSAGQRGIHILGRLSIEGLLCVVGQRSFALVDTWIPKSRSLDRDEALAEIAKRYFQSHAPATVADFAWWSGLKMSDARRGYDMLPVRP